MRPDQRDAIEAAAPDGIQFDGLELHHHDGKYVVKTRGSDERHQYRDLDDALTEYADYATNWYFWHVVVPQKDDRWAFLRWTERATDLDVDRRYATMTDGNLTRSWGQLQVTVSLGSDRERRYDLRHEDDSDRPAGELERYDDPLDARGIAQFEDCGRYRPLKTAPTLRTGWYFSNLTAAELIDAVDFFYPATIANWHRERNDTLDVTDWQSAAERQTGIYDLVSELDRDAVEWVAESCCVDSQCLKRREWEFDDETELVVDRGDGPFLCREPCSLVISAAREWTTLEREDSRRYEFDLTPSEKAQIEAIIDAVADGRTDSIRTADVEDGANQYRARYLRAKLFDENGNF